MATCRALLLFAAAAEGLLPGPLAAHRCAGCQRAGAGVRMMAGTVALQKKEQIVEGVKEVMADSALMYCVRSEGLQVNELNAFRQTLPEGVKMQCVKNTLIKIAAQDYEQFNTPDLANLCHYSNYWFFVPENNMRAGVEIWNDWIKEQKKQDMEIVGGVFAGEVLDAKGVAAISKLPTKQELMAKTATLLTVLPSKLARTLNNAGAQRLAKGLKQAAGGKMVRAVKAASEKMPE